MTDRRPVPPLLRELHALDELTPAQRASLADRTPEELAPDGPSDSAVLAEVPPEELARRVRVAAAEASVREAVFAPRNVARLVAAAAVALLAVLAVPTDLVGPPDGGVRLKGLDPTLAVYRLADEGPVRLGPGDVATAGDRLQLTLVAPAARTVLLVSVDGRGTLTEHLRREGVEPVEGELVLPTSYVLDDAPRFEAFHLLAGDAGLDLDAWLIALRARGASREAPAAPPGAELVSVVVPKVER